MIHTGSQPDSLGKTGAGDGTRTRDLNDGNVALYQLSYSRNNVETFSPQTTFTSRFYPVFILAADHSADVLSAGYGLVPYRTGQERRTSSSCACLSCLVVQKFRPKKQNPGILVEIPGR